MKKITKLNGNASLTDVFRAPANGCRALISNLHSKLFKALTVIWFVLLSLFAMNTQAAISITQFPATNFCTATYPTSYVTGSFSITEVTINGRRGFTRNQPTRTLIFTFNNANYQFNPGQGTVTVSGAGVTISSFTITSSTITVNLSTATTNTVINTLSFNNIQVRAVAAGNGFIRRNGGTFRIDNRTNRPNATTSLGSFTSANTLAFSSGSATQTNTLPVFAGTTDNLIIGVPIVITGNCSGLTAQSFNFNTTGTSGSTNPTADIANAKLYYTGTTNAFSTGTLFGSVTSPNGAFTITGSAALASGAGTYYFWLTYDLKPLSSAIPGDVVDAQVSSVTISGNANAFTGNPVGSRTIGLNNYFSIANGNWTNPAIWSATSGGPSCGCTPNLGNGIVTINNPVLLNGSFTVDVVSINAGGSLTNTGGSVLTVTNAVNTFNTGFYTASSAWVLKDVTLSGSGTSGTSVASAMTGNLTVGAGTTFQLTGGAGADLTLNGNLSVNGILAIGARSLTNSNAAGAFISGTGSITGSGTVNLGVNKTITSGSNLTISPVLSIGSGITVTNQGTVLMQNNINGGNSSSTWINAAGSSLEMAGTSSGLLGVGTLTATAVSNSVIYSGSAAQTVKLGTYHNVIFRNATKTLGGAIIVNNDLTIDNSGTLDVSASNFSVTVDGDWINNSASANPFFYRTGTVTFNGNTTISGSGISSFNNVNITANAFLIAHSTAGSFRVAGDWLEDGNFDNNNSDITFLTSGAPGGINTCAITGAGIAEFNNVIINSGKTVTLHTTETDITGNLTNNGTIVPNGGVLAFIGSGNTQTFGGTTATNTLFTVEIDNIGGNVTLSRPLFISNVLTLTNGLLITDNTNIATLTNSAVAAITAYSVTNYVSGPLARVLPANLASSANVYDFPVGKGGTYYPFSLNTITSGVTGPTVTVQAFTGNAGGLANSLNVGVMSNTEYWSASFAGNYTNGKVSLTRQIPIGTSNIIARSATQTGTYSSLHGTISGTSVINSDLTGNSLGFFLFANDCSVDVSNFSILSASSVCPALGSLVTVNSSTIPDGTYTVTYDLSGTNNSTGNAATMIFAAGSGVFTTSALANSGSTTITINSLTNLVGCSGNPAGGNTATITVNSLPSFTTCPGAQAANTINGLCNNTVNYTTAISGTSPTVTFIFSGATANSGSGDGSGSTFNTGTTNVTLTVANGCGSNTCNFNVVITDNEAPVTPTLADVTGECTATASTPTTTDNCAGTITGTTSDALTYSTQGTHVITWTFDDGNGNSVTATQNVIIDDVTPPTVAVLADVTGECTATAGAPTTTDNCSGTITGTTSDALTYSTQGTHVITWTFDDGNGNSVTATQNVIIDDVTPPTVPVLADVTGECTATAGTPTTTDNCAGTITGTTSDALTYSTQGTHVITWTFDDGNGNTVSVSQNVVIADITPPSISCPIDVTTCADPGQGGGNQFVSGTVVNLGTPTGSDNCGTVTFTNDAPALFQIGTTIVTWTADDGNGNTSTCTQNVTVNPLPSGSASNVVICSSGNNDLVLSGGATYSWTSTVTVGTVNGNTNGTGASIPDFLTNVGSVHGVVEYTITPISALGCSGDSFVATVTLGAIPVAGVISGPTVLCQIVNATYSVPANPEASTYTWSVPAGVNSVGNPTGMIITSGQGTNTITVTMPGGLFSGNVTVFETNACGVGAASSLAVSQKTVTPGPITGPTSACSLTSATYSVAPVVGATSYLWILPAGMTAVGNATGTTLNVAISSSLFHGGTLKVYSVTGCGYLPTSSNLLIYGKPAALTSLTGPVNVCGLTTATYTCSAVTGATGYTWTVPAGIVITSGQGTTTLHVNNTGFITGSITVKAVSPCGASAIRSLTLITGAIRPGAVSGPASICGLSTATYSINPVSNAVNYVWTVPSVVTILANNGTSITVSFPSTFNSGRIDVQSQNNCGSLSVANYIVLYKAVVPGAIIGDATPCPGGLNTYSIPADAASSHIWNVTGGTIQGSNNGTSVDVLWSNTLGTGTVRVAGITCVQSIYTTLTVHGTCLGPIAVNNTTETEKAPVFALYPNPTAADFNLDITSVTDQDMIIEVYDVLGNVVLNQKHSVASGETTLNTNIKNFNEGIYFVRVMDVNSNVLYTQRIVKQ